MLAAPSVISLDQGQEFKPASTSEEPRLPANYANFPFVVVHYPGGWGFDDECGEFLPELSEIVHRAGVNGVKDTPDGRLGPISPALGGAAAKGGTIVLPGDGRLGEWQHYIQRYKTHNAGFHYCMKGTRFKLLPNGKAAAVDGSAVYRTFRRKLVSSGIIAPIDEPSYNVIIDIERRGLERNLRESGRNPNAYLEAKITAKGERIARMEKAWNDANGTESAGVPMADGSAVDLGITESDVPGRKSTRTAGTLSVGGK
jgi:hypothetical protein